MGVCLLLYPLKSRYWKLVRDVDFRTGSDLSLSMGPDGKRSRMT